jgi:cytochrome c-type biogenesis protein CcmF
VVFMGRDADTDLPIIKVFLNPLMAWIWIGVGIVVVGTFIALTPNMTRTPARARQEDAVAAGLPPGSAARGEIGVLAKVPHA